MSTYLAAASFNPFWVGGVLLFLWALVLAFAFGLRSEGFPRDDKQMRGVLTVSLVLTAIAIATGILGGVMGAGETTGIRHGPPAAGKHSE